MSVTLQEFVFPSLDFHSEEALYYHANDKVIYSFCEKIFRLDKNGVLIFDTYVNSFTSSIWKKYTLVKDVSILLTLKGKFLIKIGVHVFNGGHFWIKEVQVDNSDEYESVKIDVGELNDIKDGILYCHILALEYGELKYGAFVTDSIPQNEVKLGIVITHYNRQKYVIPAINRFRKELFNDENFKDIVKLVIVDNSKNLGLESDENIIIIKNKNLGGSGGFMRGLLYLEEEGFTHAIFMDDDASTEIESIKRTVRLFQYMSNEVDRIAISGALHRNNNPGILYEKAARFEGVCRPLKHNLDVRLIQNVIYAEVVDKIPEYGGWWFFGFKINEVKYYSFPYFVRGDDILFSIVNKFKILTPNGIYVLGEDFGEKEFPLQAYLDLRYHIVNSMYKNISYFKILAVMCYLFFSRLFSYRYDSCKAMNFAIRSVISGPSFFVENIDMKHVREYISSITNIEKPSDFDLYDIDPDYPTQRDENIFRKILRVVTLNGLFIPKLFFKKRVILQEKSFKASFKDIFLYKKILYVDSTGKGYMVEFNRSKAFTEILKFIWNVSELTFKYIFLKRLYKNKLKELTSRDFWKSIFDSHGDKA